MSAPHGHGQQLKEDAEAPPSSSVSTVMSPPPPLNGPLDDGHRAHVHLNSSLSSSLSSHVPLGGTSYYQFVLHSSLEVPLRIRINALSAPSLRLVAPQDSHSKDFKRKSTQPEQYYAAAARDFANNIRSDDREEEPAPPPLALAARIVSKQGAKDGERRTVGADANTRHATCTRLTAKQNNNTVRYNYGMWLEFCVNVCDLPRDAVLEVHVLTPDGAGERLVGTVALPLFSNKRGRLRTGRYRLVMEEARHCDVQGVANEGDAAHAEAARLIRLLRQRLRHASSNASREAGAWLDELTEKRMQAAWDAQASFAPVLDITFPHAPLPCHFGEAAPDGSGGVYLGPALASPQQTQAPVALTPSPTASKQQPTTQTRRVRAPSAAPPPTMWRDPELDTESPAERMAAKLARPLARRGAAGDDSDEAAPAQQPDTNERRRLDACVAMPPHRPLGTEAKALVWRFRKALLTDAKALPKFLQAVDWLDPDEMKHALQLLQLWSPIGTLEALELLGPSGAALAARAGGGASTLGGGGGVTASGIISPAPNAALTIRTHAVAALERIDDDTLLSFLPQLVQALRYENARSSFAIIASGEGGADSPTAASVPSSTATAASALGPLARFLIRRASAALRLAVPLHWYLWTEYAGDVEREKLSPTGAHFAAVHSHFTELLRSSSPAFVDVLQRQDELTNQLGYMVNELRSQRNAARKTERLRSLLSPSGACSELASFVPGLPYMLDTAVRLTGIVGEESFVFKSALSPLMLVFRTEARRVGPPKLPLSSPRGPSSTARVDSDGFADGQSVHVIYKRGDDLRQDQLIVQMVQLMDEMLKQHGGLDLKLTPYKVLATGPDTGFVECVIGAKNVSHVLSEHKTILGYLRTTRPRTDASTPGSAGPASGGGGGGGGGSGMPTRMRGASVASEDEADADELDSFAGLAATTPPAAAVAMGPAALSDVDPTAIDNFVRSCAGYCVITYLLGVGDRHLDNLMLCPDGRMFHIDFGYILGRDPKPYPPPMKLCKEMVDAMGGASSELYRTTFVSLCVEAFNILRKNTNLFLHLFHLMSHSGLPDISDIGGGQKALLKLEERFHSDLSDEEAAAHIVALLSESLTAIFPRAVEAVHRIAQMVR